MGVSLITRRGQHAGGGRRPQRSLPPATVFGQMSEPDALRRFGRMVGVLFIAGALLPVPSTLLLEPRPELAAYSVTAASILTGILCLVLPWERARLGWLRLLGIVATLEVAATVALFDLVFSVMYLLIAILVAYGFGRPRDVFPQVALVSVALLAPVAYDPDRSREALQLALLLLPSAWMLAGALVFLRTQVDTRERTYRQFAEQALRLSERIAGRPPSRPAGMPVPARSLARREPQPPRPRRRWHRPGFAALGGLLAVPLGFAGLAAAGVKLPGAVVAPFESVGLELPNQDGDEGSDPGATDRAAPSVEPLERSGRPAASASLAAGGEGRGERDSPARERGPEAQPDPAAGGQADWSPAADPAAPAAAPTPAGAPVGGGGDRTVVDGSGTRDAATEAVRGAGAGLETLLGGALGDLEDALEK